MRRLCRRLGVAFVLGLVLCKPADAFVNCGVTATALSFGTYMPAAASNTDSTASVVVTCNVTIGLMASWTVALSTGNSGTFTTRTMSAGTPTLSYQVYIDSAHSMVWGDGTGGTSVNSGSFNAILIGTGGATYTAYGRVPALQSGTRPGSYTDTIMVTMTY